jgi:hypothetical protein
MTNEQEKDDGPVLTIKTEADADRYLELVRAMKFEAVGVHPVEARALSLVEQINQTWTYGVAIAAARQLLRIHPEAEGFQLAPGANAKMPLDVMSITPGLIGAETFAAVKPSNNGKLAKDLLKLASRPERFRYVFFMSPGHPTTARVPKLEKFGIEVWSVTL